MLEYGPQAREYVTEENAAPSTADTIFSKVLRVHSHLLRVKHHMVTDLDHPLNTPSMRTKRWLLYFESIDISLKLEPSFDSSDGVLILLLSQLSLKAMYRSQWDLHAHQYLSRNFLKCMLQYAVPRPMHLSMLLNAAQCLMGWGLLGSILTLLSMATFSFLLNIPLTAFKLTYLNYCPHEAPAQTISWIVWGGSPAFLFFHTLLCMELKEADSCSSSHG